MVFLFTILFLFTSKFVCKQLSHDTASCLLVISKLRWRYVMIHKQLFYKKRRHTFGYVIMMISLCKTEKEVINFEEMECIWISKKGWQPYWTATNPESAFRFGQFLFGHYKHWHLKFLKAQLNESFFYESLNMSHHNQCMNQNQFWAESNFYRKNTEYD